MTTRTGERTALLVIDVQNGVFAGAHDRNGVIDRIGQVVQAERERGDAIIWVQHSSEELPVESERWQIVPDLRVDGGDPVVHKRYGDSFEGTDLETVLDAADVGRVIIVGGQTDACVRSTLHGAFTRGYDVTLVADAHSTEDLRTWDPALPGPAEVIAHTNAYWSFQDGPGRSAAVVPASALLADGDARES